MLLEAHMASTRARRRTLGIPANTTKEELIHVTRDACGGNAGMRTDSLAFLEIQQRGTHRFCQRRRVQQSFILRETHVAATRARGRTLGHYFIYKQKGPHRFCYKHMWLRHETRCGLPSFPSNETKEDLIDFARGEYGDNAGPRTNSFPLLQIQQR